MRTIWRRALLVGAFCVLPWFTANAQANGFFRRDYVAVPTAYYAAVPTAYAIPTVYAYPTVYDDPITYSPTSYVAGLTSFVVPTVYETSYVAAPRRFFGRRAFAPRSYVVPAVYDYAVADYAVAQPEKMMNAKIVAEFFLDLRFG